MKVQCRKGHEEDKIGLWETPSFICVGRNEIRTMLELIPASTIKSDTPSLPCVMQCIVS